MLPLPSKPHCYCLTPDVSGNAFRAMPAGEGLWTLPTVEPLPPLRRVRTCSIISPSLASSSQKI